MYRKLLNRGACCVIILICWLLRVKSSRDIFASDTAIQILKLAKTAEIKSYMDQNVDPCDNFYKYACGVWPDLHPAQYNGHINTDRMQTLAKGIERKLINLLAQEKAGNGDVEDKIKDFYSSCLNARTDNVKYRAELSKLYRSIGEFSAFKTEEQKLQNAFNWSTTIAQIENRYGRSIMLSLYIFDDLNDKSKTMAYIGPPDFDMTQPAENLVHAVQEDRIRAFLHSYFHMPAEDAAILAKNIITFEKNLIWGATDVRNGKSVKELLTLYNTTELCDKYQDLFNVKEYLQIALGTQDLPEQLYIYDESYLEGLYHVINTTNINNIEDYILWLFIDEYMVDITRKDLKEECTEKTKKYFGKFIDHAIYNQYRNKTTEAEIYELWDDIKSTFRTNLESDKYYWMSNETRAAAIKKLHNMKLVINSYDNDNFIELFKNLSIDPNNYVINVQRILENAESLRDNKLIKKSEEDTQVLSFTPVYNILLNEIKIPVALLQPRFVWDASYPKAVKYGTLGYLLAHEMIHGFDDEGRNYDANGGGGDWWDEKSVYEFESRRKCFEEQYHNYTYSGKRLPKSALQSENIADNGGVNIAYSAYVRWLNKRKLSDSNVEANETLPRLQFNNRQLFFISFAQNWCEDILSLFRTTIASGDIHAPAKYRVIGSLSNSREFSWIFKCNTKKSNMDPPKKCEIY